MPVEFFDVFVMYVLVFTLLAVPSLLCVRASCFVLRAEPILHCFLLLFLGFISKFCAPCSHAEFFAWHVADFSPGLL